MTLTRHGHRIPGTMLDDEKKLPKTACGGPGPCLPCTEDELKAFGKYTHDRGKKP